MVKIIDAENAVVGRLASKVAKLALLGEKVIVVNADKAVVTGEPNKIIRNYVDKFDIGTPQHGPKWPKRPDTILRRTIRGMLPKNSRGKDALARVEVYIGVPEEYSNNIEKINGVEKNPMEIKYITLGELSRRIGGKWH